MRFFKLFVPCAVILSGCAPHVSKTHATEFAIATVPGDVKIKASLSKDKMGDNIKSPSTLFPASHYTYPDADQYMKSPSTLPSRHRYTDPDPDLSPLYQSSQCGKTDECGVHSDAGTGQIGAHPPY